MLRVALTLISLLSSTAFSQDKQIVVAVIDTGIRDESLPYLCKDRVDFSGKGIYDTWSHGTNVAGLIERGANGADYCQMIIKFTDPLQDKSISALNNIRLSFRYAIDHKVDIINYSGGGESPDDEEKKLVIEALDAGITLVVAAGNEHSNLNKKCDYYPACYDKRIIVVGNLGVNGKRAKTSNYEKSYKLNGKLIKVPKNRVIKHFVIGTDQEANGIKLTGTSQATAIVTGRLIKERSVQLKCIQSNK